MGLILKFRANPSPRVSDHADDSLTARMQVDVLHRHLLLALAAEPVQSVEQHRVCARQLVFLGFPPAALPPSPLRTVRIRLAPSMPSSRAAAAAKKKPDAMPGYWRTGGGRYVGEFLRRHLGKDVPRQSANHYLNGETL
jgi:hypothetical protein